MEFQCRTPPAGLSTLNSTTVPGPGPTVNDVADDVTPWAKETAPMASITALSPALSSAPVVRSQRRRSGPCRASSQAAVEVSSSRRCVSAALLALPALLAARPALALLPDDEDEECVPAVGRGSLPPGQPARSRPCGPRPLAVALTTCHTRRPGCWPRPRLGARPSWWRRRPAPRPSSPARATPHQRTPVRASTHQHTPAHWLLLHQRSTAASVRLRGLPSPLADSLLGCGVSQRPCRRPSTPSPRRAPSWPAASWRRRRPRPGEEEACGAVPVLH